MKSRFDYIFRHSLIAFIMATSLTALIQGAHFHIVQTQIVGVPIFFIVIFILSVAVSADVRISMKKIVWYDKRQDQRPIWEIGVGMLFFFTQVGFVEVFWRTIMHYNVGGMPLYIIFSFMNAFLLTVIYEELFYKEEQAYKLNKSR